jgi:hypothetical protein
MANCWETSEGRRKRADFSMYIKAPHHALTGITEQANPSLVTWLGQWQTMPCDRGHKGVCDCGQDRHHHQMARKTAEPTLHAADGIWGSHPNLEGSFPDTLGRCPLKIWLENGLVEPSPEAHLLKGMYIDRTLVWDRWEVSVRVLTATHRDQKLRKDTLWHTMNQSRWWPHLMRNNDRSETLPRSYRTWLQWPIQT